MSHDPDCKILLKASFKNVKIKACLYKQYPATGLYAGGIIFRRYFGMGTGVGFTKQQCEEMWDGISLDDHVQLVHIPTTPAPADTPSPAPAAPPSPGTCLEVYWDEDQAWYPCIIKDTATDADGTLASLCAYDDGVNEWHNLLNQVHRPIVPTKSRVLKLTKRGLQACLTEAGVSWTNEIPKPELVNMLMQHLTRVVDSSAGTAPPPATVTTPSSPPAATPVLAPATTPLSTVTSSTNKCTKPGTCLEVYWDEDQTWYPCVITKEDIDVDGTTASLCAYDDGVDEWHNLQKNEHRPITPTKSRLKKLAVTQLRQRLNYEGVPFDNATRKNELLNTLLSRLSRNPDTKLSHDTTAKVSENTTTDAVESVTALMKPQAKFGQSHAQRMILKRRKQQNAHASATTDNNDNTLPEQINPNLTHSQLCVRIDQHAVALRTLATRGDHESYEERDGYNLITLKQSDLRRWGSKHDWKAGDADISRLPKAVSCVYNVTGWTCVNTSLNGDRVIFKRPAPPLTCRGSGAAKRRRKFTWTSDMHAWLYKNTKELACKCVPFVALAVEAQQRWGYRAPEMEHLENAIKGRDKARKEGRVVRWISKYQK